MTFTVFRTLHAIIGDALDDIERVFVDASLDGTAATTKTASLSSGSLSPSGYSTSPTSASSKSALYDPPSHAVPVPLSPLFSSATEPTAASKAQAPSVNLDPTHPPGISSLQFPSLDDAYDASNPAERLLLSHPEVGAAINRIVAACGQLSVSVRAPFLSLCDASMGYHLPSCLRFLEATHTVEILREAGSGGLHVRRIAQIAGVDEQKLAHILRLLSTHHVLREVSPNVFANNRVSAYMDTGKAVGQLLRSPQKKYEGTNGIAAFVGLCTDELFKSAAYMTEAYALNPLTKFSTEPADTPFALAFGTRAGYFGWLEGPGAGDGADEEEDGEEECVGVNGVRKPRGSKFRLERFGKAMEGNSAWEAPGGLLNAGIDWSSLPAGSTIVDVGGGIGTTCMTLSEAFGGGGEEQGQGMGLKFVVQDREAVVRLGVEAFRDRCPELLDSGVVRFQVHDFFTPQPIRNASVFILRVVLHDWSDDYARKILLRLREAAVVVTGDHYRNSDGYERDDEGGVQGTTLIIADHVLPFACVDDDDDEGGGEGGVVRGAETMLAPPPLLANLGNASANGYWMDMTMQVIFNGKERTLREIVALARSAGWRVTKVTRAQGSLFGHIIAVPMGIPPEAAVSESAGISGASLHSQFGGIGGGERGVEATSWSAARSVDLTDWDARVEDDCADGADINLSTGTGRSRPATPMFGSNVDLPSVTVTSTTTSGTSRESGSGSYNASKVCDSTGPPTNAPSSESQLQGNEGRKNAILNKDSEVSMGKEKKANHGLLCSLSFPRSSSLDYCFSHRSNQS